MDTSQDNARRLRRILLNCALVCWFSAVAFGFGPNVIMFHKLTSLTPADFVPIVNRYCVPAVRAMKLYERKNGHLPDTADDLGPPFSTQHGNGPGMNMIGEGGPGTYTYTYWAFGMYIHEITYDFTPGHEGWTVHGAFANGPIPVPPVILEPDSTTP